MEGVVVFLSLFDENPAVYRAFCPPREAYIHPPKPGEPRPLPPLEDLLETGHVLGLNFPVAMNPALARGLGVMLKLDFQRAVLQRIPKISANPKGVWRDILFVADEYHAFATVGETDPTGDERAFALSRQARLMPIVATQSISSLRSALGIEGKAVPQRVVEASQTEARQAGIALAERRQMLRLSGLSDADISRLTDEAAITATLSVAAPEPATVVEIAISPGQRVEQSAPLVKLARLSPLWAEIAIPASSIRAIRPGAKVEVDGYATPGQVVLVSETTDAATQTVLVRAELPNNGELRPGQTAAVRISFLSAGESAWEVPYSAVVRRGEAAAIFVAIEGGFRLIPVTLLAEDQDHVVVAGKVTDKNEVAVSGISALRGILLRLGAGN